MDDDDKKSKDEAAEPARDAAQEEGAKLRELRYHWRVTPSYYNILAPHPVGHNSAYARSHRYSICERRTALAQAGRGLQGQRGTRPEGVGGFFHARACSCPSWQTRLWNIFEITG